MFVFVTLGEGRDTGFDLRNIPAAIIDGLRSGDAWNRKVRIDIVADPFNLFELVLNANPVGLGCGQFTGQLLEFVFNETAAATGTTGATLATGCGSASSKL